MEQHTYAIMDRVEDTHWWFVGRRAILESFLDEIVSSLSSKFQVPSSKSDRSSLTEGFELDQSNPEPETLNTEPAECAPGPAEGASVPSTQYPVLRILDVGCGTGANLEMLSQYGEAEGVDVSDEALEFCRKKGLNTRKGLAEELPFEDDSFDLVTGLDVVEHLDDDIAGLKEMNRVLRPGGQALIFVPAFMWLWGVQDDISNHRIRYTRKQIVERLNVAGFTVERATYANITFLIPVFAGRIFMRLTGIKPESENNINVSALNGFFASIFSAERFWLRKRNLPFGVSIVISAAKRDQNDG